MNLSNNWQYDFYFLKFQQTSKLFEIFLSYGIEAKFVGGCVRDAVCGEKTEDFDLAVSHDILYVKKILEDNGVKCIATGIKYGSITAIVAGMKFELTTLRRDEKCSGRDCEVVRSYSFEEDAKRRDFTMNALYVSKDGELIDYFDGVSDVKAGRVIFIGNPAERIKEDYLRILRYYRFCARYGDISDRYQNFILNEAANVSTLSIERIQKELWLIIKSEYSLEVLKLIHRNGVFYGMNLDRYSRLLEFDKDPPFELKLYMLFDEAVLSRVFKLSRVTKAAIKHYKKYNVAAFI